MKTSTETIHSLQFSYLPSYAQYLLDQKLEAFVGIQQEIAEQLNIPLLQALKNIPDNEVKAYTLKANAEFLTSLATNNAEKYIVDSISRWKKNTLPLIDKYQVVAEDLSLISFTRKKAFLHFLPSYCPNAEQIIQIIEELDYFLTKQSAATTETYLNILQEKIAEHTHFIEKINTTSPSVIYVFDILEQKTLYTNGKFYDILGYQHEDLKDTSIDFLFSLIHPDDLKGLHSYFNSFHDIADKDIRSYKYRIKDKDNTYRWVRNYDTVFKRKEGGSVWQIIGVVIDVNKEKTISDELRKREEQLTEAQALAHIGSWSWNLETGDILWSDEMYRIYNINKEATTINYDILATFTHSEDKQFVLQHINEALDKREATEFQYRIITTDEKVKFINATAEIIVDQKGKAVELIGTVQDITERQKLLDNLKRNEALYRQAEQLANLGNWIWDLKTNKLEWTDQLYRIYGLEPQAEEISIDRFLSFIHPDNRTTIEKMVLEVNEDVSDHTFKIITAQGETKTLRSIAHTQRDNNGQVIKIIGTEQDVTERETLLEGLRHSDALFKQAEALTHIGTWEWEINKDNITWTDELYRIYNIEPQSKIIDFQTYSSLLHPDDREQVIRTIKKSMQTGKPYELHYRILLENGTIRFIQSHGEVKKDKDGRVYKLIGTAQDISDQYLTQQELKEKQTFIQKITDAAPSIITSYNVLTDQYEFVNEGIKNLLGYQPKEVIGKGSAFFTQMIHPDDANELVQQSYLALHEANSDPEYNKVSEFTYRMMHRDGNYRWFNTYATVFDRNHFGQVEHVLRISLDVTEQMNAREKIEEQEFFIKQVADASPTILYLYDTIENRFTYINHEIYYAIGYTPDNILAMKDEATALLYHPDDLHLLPERPQTEKKFQHSNSMIQYECRIKNKAGDWCWLVVREVIFKRDEQGKPSQILGAALDITKRKEMEKSLLQNAFQLQQSNASLEEFAYVASHDLKEPLRKISTFGDRIIQTQQERLNEDGKIYLKKIIDASHRMQIMINDLLSISMITGDRTFQPFSLQTILEEVKQTLEFKIEKKNAIIEADQLPEANIVASQFRQLFQNLISNSLKFTRDGIQPHIRIEWDYLSPDDVGSLKVNKAPHYLKLEFADNGIGFEEEYAGKIFQIFQRLHGRSEYEGTGIGLAICKKIIEHHGGTIYAHGFPERGATFTIILPA